MVSAGEDAGGAGGLTPFDDGADRELADVVRRPHGREAAVRRGGPVRGRRPCPARLAATALDLDRVAAGSGADVAVETGRAAEHLGGPRLDGDAVAGRGDGDVSGLDLGALTVAGWARPAGGRGSAGRGPHQGGSGQREPAHGEQHGDRGVSASGHVRPVHPLFASCLRGELTGSRFAGATVSSGTDSPLRTLRRASGSPADRPRTDDRSAGRRGSIRNARTRRGNARTRRGGLGAREPRHGAADRPGADRQADLGELRGRLHRRPEHVGTVRGGRPAVAGPRRRARRLSGLTEPGRRRAGGDASGRGGRCVGQLRLGRLGLGRLGLGRLGVGLGVGGRVDRARRLRPLAIGRAGARAGASDCGGAAAYAAASRGPPRGVRRSSRPHDRASGFGACGPPGNGIERIAQFAGRNLKRVGQFYVVVINNGSAASAASDA